MVFAMSAEPPTIDQAPLPTPAVGPQTPDLGSNNRLPVALGAALGGAGLVLLLGSLVLRRRRQAGVS